MKRLHLAAAAAFLATATTASAAVIVVRSFGPSARAYPQGKGLADDSRLTLRDGDTVVLLDARGTRTLRGPGSFAAATPADAAVSTSSLAALLGQGSGRRVRVGAVRGPVTRGIWHASASHSETICYDRPADLGIWREDIAAGETLTLKDESGHSAALVFPPQIQTVAWPTAVPVESGAHYRLSNGTVITTRPIAPVPPGLDQLAEKLITNDCQAQIDVLVNNFTTAAAE